MTHSLGLIFSGQGAQTVGMMHSLYQGSSLARSLMDSADALLGNGFKSVCFEGPEETLTQTAYCQPALYVHGYIIYKLLQEKGLLTHLSGAWGLSLGELTALAVAGVYDFETGLRIVAKRGELMQQACMQTEGSMASILGGSFDSIVRICEACDVDVGNKNCPGQVVISGAKDNIAKAVTMAKETGEFKRVIPLNVAGAYHSRLMQSASQSFAAFIHDIPFNRPTLTVFTNTTGQSISEPAAIKQALVQQIVSTVLFEDCVQNAASAGIQTIFECGPGGVLAGLVKRTVTTPVQSFNEWSDLSSAISHG